MEEKSKGNMPQILTKFLKKKIEGLLSGYLKKTGLNKINLGLSNVLEFLNVELREDILMKLQLPLIVAEGRIGKLSIKLSMPTSNSEIKIENVFVRIISLRENRNMNPKEDGDQTGTETDFKSQRIKEWEIKMKKYFDGMLCLT